MFEIKRIADPRLSSRICGSYGVDNPGAFAYGVFKNGEVLATAVFSTAPGGKVTFCAVDTGKRLDIPLIDGIARAAFSSQMKAGAKTAMLGEGLPKELKIALTKLGYGLTEFSLTDFFAKKSCSR